LQRFCINSTLGSLRSSRAKSSKSQLLCETPLLGRPIGGRAEYRQVVLQVLNAAYVFQYRFDGARLVMLRVFHGREKRD
jgi:plasmid stabilization system protein ParE